MFREIQVKVTPRARKNFVKEEGGILRVYTASPALEGRANEAVVDMLAEHFSVRKSQLEIVRGLKSRLKIVRITD